MTENISSASTDLPIFDTYQPLSKTITYLRKILDNRINQQGRSPESIRPPELLTLTTLGEKLQLSTFERLILLLALGLEIEPNLRQLCAQAQGGQHKNHATLALALSLFPGADWAVLSPQSPLHYWQLIHTEPGRFFTEAPIKLDRRILCYLLGEVSLDSALADLVVPLPVSETLEDLAPSYQTIAQQITAIWSGNQAYQSFPLIVLTGVEPTTRRQIAAIASNYLGFQTMALPATVLPTDPHDLMQLQRHWQREAILSNSVLLLEDYAASDDPARQRAIALFIETLTTPVIVSRHNPLFPLQRSIVNVDIPSIPHHEQVAIWSTHLEGIATDLNSHIDVLANQFRLNHTVIQTVCTQFKYQYSNADTQPDANTLKNHLWQLCREQARPNLDALAQRIEARATLDELVLPDRPRQLLEDIATRLKYCAQIYQDWGFSKKGDRGLGISALFHGESGTGKTMAAEVIAQICQLDLYRIDLSNVVSKYIGETEKNLRQIFDAAETGGVILLFDEADALFGKRTEVKDSHDRHANIEVSYLLQRMESYSGLAILTSNLKQNLDQAFLRRLQFIVPFPFPDIGDRTKIWQSIFPTQAPCQDLDYDKLGQLKISGGNIRNIALNAAFLAAQSNSPITMEHIRQAAQRDYTKLEKLLTTEELKGWGDRP